MPPILLRRKWDIKKFLGLQILFLGKLSQSILAHSMVFLASDRGYPHALAEIAPRAAVVAFAAASILCEIATIPALALSVATPRHRGLIWWMPLMHFYFSLSAIVCRKAIWELGTRPWYWDKTAHGGPANLPKRRWHQRLLQHPA